MVTRDLYSNRIDLYKDCIDFLRLFSKPNQEVYKSNVGEMRVGIKSVITTLQDLNAINVDFMSYISNENTIKYRYNRYFEDKIDELEAARSRDNLSERSTISSEESASSAKLSTKLAVGAVIAAIISALFAALTYIYK